MRVSTRTQHLPAYVSANRLTLLVGSSSRHISSQELSLLNAAGCIERDKEDRINWVEKRTVRFLRPEFKMRGASSKYGEMLAQCIQDKEFWALLMKSQICTARVQKSHALIGTQSNGIRPINRKVRTISADGWDDEKEA